MIYTGEINLQDIEVDFYNMGTGDDGLPIEIPVVTNENPIKATKIESNTGIVRFAVKLPLQNKPEVYIRVKSKSGFILAETVADVTFANSTALLNFYNPTSNTKFAVPASSTQFNLYNKTATAYGYELMTSYPYNGVNYSPIYNDANLSTTKNWVTSNETEYNSATSKDILPTGTFDFFDGITVNNFGNIASATSFSNGFVYKVQKTRYVAGTAPTVSYTWQSATFQDYNDAFLTQTYYWDTVDGSSCNNIFTLTANNVANLLGSSQGYTNGTVVRVSPGYILDGTPYDCGNPNPYRYFIAVHTNVPGGQPYYEPFSPITYKYYRVQAQIVGFTGNILAYNASDGKLYDLLLDLALYKFFLLN
jgi:hypothetical protein